MTLLEKIKYFIKGIKPAGEFIKQIKGARLKFKTIPFWLTLLTSASALVAAFQGLIPMTVAVIITAVLTGAYNILRGLDKMDMEGIRGTLLTTEYWIGTLGIISTSLVNIQGVVVDSKIISGAIAFIAAAMSIAQQLGAVKTEKVPDVNIAGAQSKIKKGE